MKEYKQMSVLTQKTTGSKESKAWASKTRQRKTNPNNVRNRNGREADLRQMGRFTFRVESLP